MPGLALMAIDIAHCAYCTEEPATTADHVPPKSFFPSPKPSNLITVPACPACNQGAGKDEEFFLATFMFSDAGTSEAGTRLWNEKLRRMYSKNWGLRRAIGSLLSHVNVTTPAGLYLGRRIAIDVDDSRLERVVTKIVRGLYFFEYGDRLHKTSSVQVLYLRSEDHVNLAKAHNHEMRDGSRGWDGVFRYRFNRVATRPQGSLWLLMFYDFAVFMAVTNEGRTAES